MPQRLVFVAALLVFVVPPTGLVRGQAPTTPASWGEPRTIPLWDAGAPGALGSDQSDQPSLVWYPPYGRNVSGTGVIVAPGGAYLAQARNHEGRQAANWFNALGVGAFVLNYRLGPRYHHPIELGDARRAIRLVRSRAKEFGLSPSRIGVMGFSAGGHLASTAETLFDAGDPQAPDPIDRLSSRPDFAILAYPVITMLPPYTHEISAQALLGDNPDTALRRALSSELNVTAETPPTFIFATTTDTTVPVENSVNFYLALKRAGVPAELHVFGSGPHGVGLDLADPALGLWPKLLEEWLRNRGLLSAPPSPGARR